MRCYKNENKFPLIMAVCWSDFDLVDKVKNDFSESPYELAVVVAVTVAVEQTYHNRAARIVPHS